MTPSEERAVGGIYPRAGGDLKLKKLKSREIMNISFIPIKTKKVMPPQEDIFPILGKELAGKLRENDVLLITSKILGIHQGNCVKIAGNDKDELIKKEADQFISRDLCPNKNAILTINFLNSETE